MDTDEHEFEKRFGKGEVLTPPKKLTKREWALALKSYG
jgi:hypothetical protein